MYALIRRLLLVCAALICGLGALAHAAAYGRAAVPALDKANLAPFFAAELKVLWLADSTTLTALALLFAYIAWRPASVGAGALMLVALVPGATAILLYLFLGGFYAGHLLLAASIMAVIAGALPSVKNQLGAAEQRNALS